MNALIETRDLPPLEHPLLLHAFGGRMGNGGNAILEYLADKWQAEPVGRVEPATLYDFSALPPTRRRADDGYRIVWPEVRLLLARPAGSDRDVLILFGPEPHYLWPALAGELASVLAAAGIAHAIQVLALKGATPHTRPAPVQALDAPPEVAAGLGVVAQSSAYEGPVGFGTVLADALEEKGISTSNLLVLGSFYLGLDPTPHAAIEVIHAIDRLVGSTTDLEELRQEQLAIESRALDALARSEEFRTLVATLERQYDSNLLALSASSVQELDGPALAADADAFLRSLNAGSEGSPPSDA